MKILSNYVIFLLSLLVFQSSCGLNTPIDQFQEDRAIFSRYIKQGGQDIGDIDKWTDNNRLEKNYYFDNE